MALELTAVVGLDKSGFASGITAIGESCANITGAMMASFSGVTTEIFAMTRAFGVAGLAVSTLKQVSSVGMGVQQAMADLKVETGFAADEVNALTSLAMQMSTKMTAGTGDIVKAMTELHGAGAETASAIRDTLTPALHLAEIAGISTAQASDTLVKTMYNFGIESSKSTNVLNSFVAAAGKMDLAGFSEAMLKASQTAHGYGISMSETAAMLSLFEKAGVESTKAGAAFTGIMDKLSDAARSAKGALGEALAGWNPATEGMAGALDRLKRAGIDTQTIFGEFGDKVKAAMQSMGQSGGTALRELTAEIDKGGNAAKLYDEKTGTLGGNIKMLMNSIQNLNVSAFLPMSQYLQNAVAHVQDVINIFGKLISKIPELAGPIKETLGGGIEKAINWFKGLDDSAKGIIAGLGGLSVAFVAFGPSVVSFGQTVAAMSMSALKSFLAFAVPALSALAALTVAFAAFSLGETIGNIKAGSDTINGHITSFLTSMVIKFESFYEKAANWFAQLMAQIEIFVLDNAPGVIEAFGKMLAPIIEKFGEFRAKIFEFLGMKEAADEVRASSQKMAESLKAFDGGVVLNNARGELSRLQDEMKNISETEAVKLKAAMEMAGAAAAENLKKGIEPAQVFDKWLSQMNENGGKVWETIVEGGDKAKSMFTALMEKLGITGLSFENFKKSADGTAGTMKDIGTATSQAAKETDGLKVSVTDLVGMMAAFKNAKINSFDISDFVDAIKQLKRGLEGFTLPDIRLPDFSKFSIPKIHSMEMTNFVSAMQQLAKGLMGVDLTSLDSLMNLDFTGIKIPNLRMNTVNDFLASMRTLKNGLMNLNFGDLGQMDINITGGSSDSTLKEILGLLKGAKGVVWA